jgi:hypothetical protein
MLATNVALGRLLLDGRGAAQHRGDRLGDMGRAESLDFEDAH